MKTRMMFAALMLSVALCGSAFTAEPAAPATPPVPAAAGTEQPQPCPEKKPYFADWKPMRPVKSMLMQLKCIGGALCGNHCCNEGSQPKVED
jgi:hypothetical protein